MNVMQAWRAFALTGDCHCALSGPEGGAAFTNAFARYMRALAVSLHGLDKVFKRHLRGNVTSEQSDAECGAAGLEGQDFHVMPLEWTGRNAHPIPEADHLGRCFALSLASLAVRHCPERRQIAFGERGNSPVSHTDCVGDEWASLDHMPRNQAGESGENVARDKPADPLDALALVGFVPHSDRVERADAATI